MFRFFIVLNLILLCGVSLIFAQGNVPPPISDPGNFGQIDLPQNEQNIRAFTHQRNFYRKTGFVRLQFAPGYSGFDGTLTKLSGKRLSYGFTFQVNSIIQTNQEMKNRYADLQPAGQYLFVPFLFNVKFHLRRNSQIRDVSPYLIAGFGPALGLYFPYGNNFFKTLGAISGEIGGGGFLGAGVDYLWQEEWALSFDVRYNAFGFADPLGDNQNYQGVSFFIGFAKALDY